jgi:hypothetical protein
MLLLFLEMHVGKDIVVTAIEIGTRLERIAKNLKANGSEARFGTNDSYHVPFADTYEALFN